MLDDDFCSPPLYYEYLVVTLNQGEAHMQDKARRAPKRAISFLTEHIMCCEADGPDILVDNLDYAYELVKESIEGVMIELGPLDMLTNQYFRKPRGSGGGVAYIRAMLAQAVKEVEIAIAFNKLEAAQQLLEKVTRK